MDERCGFCRFFLRGAPRAASGLCRRFPPVSMDNGRGGHATVRVEVCVDGWCGEFQERSDVDLERKLCAALGPNWRQIVSGM